MKDAPRSYKDPQYAALDTGVEQKLGLPSGLLSTIRLHGERSNADQVSEAGARTVYQITPSTRKLVLDKYGVDAYLSAETAAEAAGLLLKEALERNKGDATLAAAEYHGGTDRKNWGPRTRAYVDRVSKALGAAPAAQPAEQPQGQSTFQRVLARQKAQMPTEPQIASIFQAYQSGQMAPEEAAEFERDVKAGTILLPRGAALKGEQPAVPNGAPTATANVIPDGVIEAYVDGRMSQDERAEFERDIRSGLVKLPEGITLAEEPPEPGLLDQAAALPGAVKEAVTGEQRTTPEIQAALDEQRTIYDMPESNQLSWGLVKAAFGGLMANSKERAQIFAANLPGVQVREDQMGNQWLRSPTDGREYVIPPGFKPQDVPRATAQVGAFVPAGRAATVLGSGAAAGLTQAAIEASQEATGGEFNPGDVATAGAFGAAVPMISNAIRYGAGRGRELLQRMRGAAQAAPDGAPVPAVVPQPGAPVTPAPAPVTQTAPAVTQNPSPTLKPVDELGQTMRTASLGGIGSKKAQQILAQQAAPDAETVAAAQRLGIAEHLQPDHVTTNQAFRQLAGLVKSQTGSEAAAAQHEGLLKVAERAAKIVEDIGGSPDVSTLSANVRSVMQATHDTLRSRADDLYAQVRSAIPAKTQAPAPQTISLIRQRANDLGGERFLTALEKRVLATVEDAKAPPTYARLDDLRIRLNAAKFGKAEEAFTSADDALRDRVLSALRADQEAVATSLGQGEAWNLAQATARAYKGMQDDMSALFGKRLDESMAPILSGTVKNLEKGNAESFVKFISTVPKDMRQQVTASGLASFFQRTARGGEMDFAGFSRWYEGLARNKQAHAALMSNLPPETARQIADLARVARGVAMAKGEFIATGKAINPQVLQPAETLIGRIYDEVRRRGVAGLAAETVGTASGAPGLASALMSATARNKPSILKAADQLISSPEFLALVRAAGTPKEAAAVRAFAYSKAFTRFLRAIGQPRELSNRERWVLQALQAQNQQRQ